MTARIDFSKLEENQIGLVVYNSSHFEREEVVNCLVDIPTDWGMRWSGTNRRDFNIEAVDAAGNPVSCKISCLDDDYVFGYLKFGNVMGYETTRCYIAVSVKVPACGYTTLTLTPKKLKQGRSNLLVNAPNCMKNGNLMVEIAENGTLTVTDIKSGRRYENMNYFEDSSDKGGPLRYDPAYSEGSVNTLSARPEIMLVKNTELEASYRITYHWSLPASIDTELRIHVPHGSEWVEQGPFYRSNLYVDETIVSEVTLRKGSNKVDITTTVDNKAKDHRLRVMFPTRLEKAVSSIADSPFDVVKRAIAVPDSTGWYEEAARTWPTKSMVAVAQGDASCLLVHDCFTEYEVTDDDDRAIALTMLRCFSTAGNPTETHCYQELAECLGTHKFRYAIDISAADDTAEMLRRAQSFINPLHVAQTTAHSGELGAEGSFIELETPDFIVTALKKAEDDNAVIIRGYLEADKAQDVAFGPGFGVKKAERVDLQEKSVKELDVTGGRVSLSVGAKEIVGIKLYI